MKNILVIYGSTTGNSHNLSKYCVKILQDNFKLELKNCVNLKACYSFDNNYDAYILCVSTWGIDPAELQEDFEIFWLQLNNSSIANKKFIILGLGDNYYPFFARATEILQNSIIQNNGNILCTPLKINDPWVDAKEDIKSYLKKTIAKI